MARVSAMIAAGAILLAGTGCTGAPQPAPSGDPTTSPTAAPPATQTPTEEPDAGVQPTGDIEVVADGLTIPWSVVPLPEGGALISERNSARVLELTPDGDLRDAGTVPGVAPGGEGGLLGLALLGEPGGDDAWLYAYFTSADDNRVVRMPLSGDPGSLALGDPQNVLTGIPAAGTHNGGRIAFGPDGMLYVTAGDAQRRELPQDPEALAGKILRITPEGDVPEDNPFDGSPVWSYGHRNPQGIAWDGEGRMWASEFGQNTWDELNRIEPGQNYGWPVVEGAADGDDDFVDPVHSWSPAEASPSGLTWIDGTLFLAALRGQRLWSIDSTAEDPQTADWFVGEYGRLRDAVAAPDGSLWLLTNDTGNDRLLRVELEPR